MFSDVLPSAGIQQFKNQDVNFTFPLDLSSIPETFVCLFLVDGYILQYFFQFVNIFLKIYLYFLFYQLFCSLPHHPVKNRGWGMSQYEDDRPVQINPEVPAVSLLPGTPPHKWTSLCTPPLQAPWPCAASPSQPHKEIGRASCRERVSLVV